MSGRIRVGIVGTGNAGRHIHLRLLQLHSDLYEVVACADAIPQSARQFAADAKLRAHETAADLVADAAVELVVVATRPPVTHRDVAVPALVSGKHVVVEKPMAGTPEQCAEMIAAGKAAGTVLSVHHNRRWDVDFLNTIQALNDSLVGKPRLVRNEYTAGYAGSSYDWGIHIIDQTMCLSRGAQFIELSAVMAKPNAEDPLLGEGFWSARLRADDGVVHDVGMLPTVAGNAFRPGVQVPRFFIAGTAGVFHQTWCQRPEDAFGGSIRFEGAEPGQPGFGDPRAVTAALAIPDFYQQLHDAIRHGAAPPVTPESAARSVQAWYLICRAAAVGETLKIDL